MMRKSDLIYIVEPYSRNTIGIRVGYCKNVEFAKHQREKQVFAGNTRLRVWLVEKGHQERMLFHDNFRQFYIMYDLYKKEGMDDYIGFLDWRNGKGTCYTNPGK